MRNFKSWAWPAILLPHMKLSKGVNFEWIPILKIGQIWHKNGQKGLRNAQNMPFFKIWLRIMIIQIFLVRKMPLVVDFDANLTKREFFRKVPKIGKKMRKIETCPWTPIFVAHMKFSKKTYFEWVPSIKIGQIITKKCQNGLRSA